MAICTLYTVCIRYSQPYPDNSVPFIWFETKMERIIHRIRSTINDQTLSKLTTPNKYSQNAQQSTLIELNQWNIAQQMNHQF